MRFLSRFRGRQEGMIAKLGLRSFLTILILAASEVAIFGVSYFITVILPRSWDQLHISEADISIIVSVFGGVVLISQLPAGILADRFSNKLLIYIGLLSSALSLLWFAFLVHFGDNISNESLFYQYVTICILWGLSTSLFFWTPMQRLVSQQASKENQGLAYNLSNSANGIFGTLFIWILGIVVIILIERYQSSAFFAYYIYFNCLTILVMVFLVHLALRRVDTKVEEKKEEKKEVHSQGKTLLELVRNWKIWALSFGLLAIVIYQGILGIYLKDFLSNTLVIPAVWVSILAGLRLFVARLSILPLARRIDRIPSFILALVILQIVAAISILPFILLPGFSTHPATYLEPTYLLVLQILLGALFVLTGFIAWLMISMQFTQAFEVKRPPNSYGATIGLLAMVAYSSRAWFPLIVSSFISKNQIEIGGTTLTSWHVYQAVFAAALLISLLAAAITFFVYLSNKRELKRLGKTNFRWHNLENS